MIFRTDQISDCIFQVDANLPLCWSHLYRNINIFWDFVVLFLSRRFQKDKLDTLYNF